MDRRKLVESRVNASKVENSPGTALSRGDFSCRVRVKVMMFFRIYVFPIG